jgi:hypothetical protein
MFQSWSRKTGAAEQGLEPHHHWLLLHIGVAPCGSGSDQDICHRKKLYYATWGWVKLITYSIFRDIYEVRNLKK